VDHRQRDVEKERDENIGAVEIMDPAHLHPCGDEREDDCRHADHHAEVRQPRDQDDGEAEKNRQDHAHGQPAGGVDESAAQPGGGGSEKRRETAAQGDVEHPSRDERGDHDMAEPFQKHRHAAADEFPAVFLEERAEFRLVIGQVLPEIHGTGGGRAGTGLRVRDATKNSQQEHGEEAGEPEPYGGRCRAAAGPPGKEGRKCGATHHRTTAMGDLFKCTCTTISYLPSLVEASILVC
jgi:hypothetical protein